MKNRLLMSLVAFIAILGLNVLAQAEADITQITTNSYEDSFPQIKGNYVVWQGRVAGDWEIFVYNIDTGITTQITDNDYGDISPQTDGDYVVWLGFSLSGGEIFQYNISSGETTQITSDSNVDSPPQIANGRVAWTSHEVTDSVEPGEIFLYYIITKATTFLSASVDPVGTLDDSSPRINDESIMWVQADDAGNTTLFIHYFGNSTESAPEGFVWTDSPQTDGDLTVLTRYDGSDREVVVYNASLKTYEQITDNDLEDSDPRISGNKIAWVGGEGNTSEIFLCDLCDNEPITGSVSPSIDTLWPPNHRMIPVSIDASALVTHNPDTQITITSVATSEYSSQEAGEDYGENIYDENKFEPDWEITGDLTLNLRSERSGSSTGRTYTITVTASDCSGDYFFSTEVVVPQDKGR